MEIPMSYSLNIRAYFFNAKTDYLPYYKNFSIHLPKESKAKAILEAVKAQNENFSYPELNLVFKINDLVVEEDTPLSNIIRKFGTSLKIDPVSTYRSTNGLIINNDDFMQSFELLAPYASESDKKYYKSLYALHYASETSAFDRDYIGDAILVLAHKMIAQGHEEKEAILDAITSVDSGLFDCEYENNLFNEQSYDAAITALKDMVKDDGSEYPSLLDMIKSRFSNKTATPAPSKEHEEKSASVTIENLENKQVAYYPGKCYSTVVLEEIKAQNMAMVTFDRMHKLSGSSLLKDSKVLAFRKAGATLLDAYDAGAEVLIVENERAYRMFNKYFKEIENTIGRKIIGLELMTSLDFIEQVKNIEA